MNRKQIKVVLSLDDAGFSQKLLGAHKNLKTVDGGLGALSKSVAGLESTIDRLTKHLAGFSTGFGAMQKQVLATVESAGKATAAMHRLDGATEKSARVAKLSAQAQIDSKVKALKSEIDTNRQVIAKREQYLGQLLALEQQYEAKAQAQRMLADKLRSKKKAGSAAEANTELNVAKGYADSAQVIRREIAETQRLVAAKRAELAARTANISSLERQKTVLDAVSASNKRAVEMAQSAGRTQADLMRRSLMERQAADRASEQSAQQAARMRINAAREVAAEERRQAEQIGLMWKGMAQMYAASKIQSGLGASVNKADDYARVIERLDGMGLDGAPGKQRILAVSKNVESANPNMNRTDALKLTMSAVAGAVSTDTKLLTQIVPEIAKVQTMMARQFPDQAHNLEDFGRNIMGVMEARGIVDDPKKMLETLDNLARALILTQGKMTVQDYETLSRRGGAGNAQLKDNASILYDIAAASQLKVMGGGGGSGGGGVSTFATMQKFASMRMQGGKRETLGGLENQVEFGIINKEKLLEANKGKALGARYRVVPYEGADLAAANPTMFAMDLVNKVKAKLANLPASDQRFFAPGADRSSDAVQAQAFGRFADKTWQHTNVAEFYKMFATKGSQHRITAEVEASEAAPTYGESHERAMNSWGVAVDKTKASLIDLGVTIGQQLIPVLQPMLETVTAIIRSMVEFGQNNPMAAKLGAIAVAGLGVTFAFKSMTGIYGMVGGITSGLTALAAAAGRTSTTAGTMANASQRVSNAHRAELTNAVRVTDAHNQYAQMQLRAAQATVANASGMGRLTAVTNTLVPAQNAARIAAQNHLEAQTRLTAQQAASRTGARLLGGAMNMLGGPIGAVITLLTIGITAWTLFGNAASEAKNKAKQASEDSAKAIADTVKRLQDDITVVRKGENAPLIDTEKAEIDKLKAKLAQKEKQLDMQSNLPASNNADRDLADNKRKTALVDDIDELRVNIGTREGMLDTMSDLATKRAIARAKQEAEEMAAAKARIAKELKDAGVKAVKPSTEADEDDPNATVSLDGLTQPGRVARDHIDPLTRALEEARGKVAANKVAISALKIGVEEIADIRAEVAAELEGKRRGGAFNKDRDQKNPVAASDARFKALVDETTQLRLQEEQKKALEFANQRIAATSSEAGLAMERMANNGADRQTESFRALTRELERAEERLGAGAVKMEAWNAAKNRALAGQARADGVNMAADYQGKTATDKVELIDGERQRTMAQMALAASVEDQKFTLRLNTMARTHAAELAAMTTNKATEEQKLAVVKEYTDAREVLETAFAERKAVREQQNARAVEEPMQKLTREWRDTYAVIGQIQTNAANSFVNMLSSSLTTGRMEVKNFLMGVLADIANAKIKQVMAGQFDSLLTAGGQMLGSWLGGGGAAGTGAASTAGGPGTAGWDGYANTFAKGGVMTDFGPIELRKYARGGVANSPQLALYGEAGPEAYVPLPDGRSIPVTMRGTGASAPPVTVNVINQSGQSVKAEQGEMRFDGKGYILDVVMTAANQPGAFRSGMKNALK